MRTSRIAVSFAAWSFRDVITSPPTCIRSTLERLTPMPLPSKVPQSLKRWQPAPSSPWDITSVRHRQPQRIYRQFSSKLSHPLIDLPTICCFFWSSQYYTNSLTYPPSREVSKQTEKVDFEMCVEPVTWALVTTLWCRLFDSLLCVIACIFYKHWWIYSRAVANLFTLVLPRYCLLGRP